MTPAQDPVRLRRWIDILGGQRPVRLTDWLPTPFFICLGCVVLATTDASPRGRLVRASLIPLMLGYQAWFCLFLEQDDWLAQWNVGTIHLMQAIKALEVLLFHPPEETAWRMIPLKAGEIVVDSRPGEKVEAAVMKSEEAVVEFIAEPIPPAWTWAKLQWAFDLWLTFRGIGWNWAAPLPASSSSPPFTRTSRPIDYIINRTKYLVALYIVGDLARSYMAFGPGAAFFSGRPGLAPAYETLTIPQRALYSLPVAARILYSVDAPYVLGGIIFVAFGAWTGRKGVNWEPWGWPPLFGTMRDLWVHPGLSYMWSKTWHQYFHHWLYIFGWLGIGETILGLPPSGVSTRKSPSSTPPTTRPSSPTPSVSAQTPTSRRSSSPKHPLPASTARPAPVRMLLVNFLKSLIVFTLTGLHHDIPTYLLLIRTSPAGAPIPWKQGFPTTIFFVLQPVALALEAFIKRRWRAWKNSAHPTWRMATEEGKDQPDWLIQVERGVGFVWTWWWLGHTAKYFVTGLTRSGLYLWKEGQMEVWSPMGGLVYGRWVH